VNNAVSRIAALLAIAILGSLATSLFAGSLASRMNAAPMQAEKRQEIISQSSKMAGISIPENFAPAEKEAAETAVKQSFVHAFRIVVGISAVLALLSASLFFFFA
jgi:hypothetical protein